MRQIQKPAGGEMRQMRKPQAGAQKKSRGIKVMSRRYVSHAVRTTDESY
jgi:hypothetical protein